MSQPRARTRARTAAQLDRQSRVFALNVIDGKSQREIAAELRISRATVAADIGHEEQRRVDELAERREAERVNHLARLDDFFRRSMERADIPGSGALAAAAKALEMRAKILGLEAAIKLDSGIQDLIDALAIPEDDDPAIGRPK